MADQAARKSESLDRFCGFGQSDPCYAALGHKLNLLMVLDTSEYDLKIIKRINNTQDDPLCRVKYGRMKDCDLYNNRPEVTFINGTLIIKHVIRADSGNYTLRLSRSDGTETSTDLQVIVEAPIGSVNVSISCSSNQSSVSCSSEGDQIIYNWTLNGIILEQGPMVRNTTIQLNETSAIGNISCSVKNNVSYGEKTISVEPCPVFVLVWCFQLMVLLGLLGGFHIYMRHTSGLDRFCRFDQSDPCYAALGHKLNLLMLLDTSEYDLQIIKRINNTQDDPFCRVKYGRMKECDLYNNRPEVTVIDRTLVIKSVIRADSGNYTFKFDVSEGVTVSTDLQVIVEVSVVFVLVWCFQLMVLLDHEAVRCFLMCQSSVSLAVKTLDERQNTDGQKSRRSEAASHSSAGFGLFWKLDFREMMLIFGLMLLLQTTACLDRFCRFDQSDPCYAALGHKLNLLMLMVLLGLLGGFHIYMRHMSGVEWNCRPEVTVINGTLIIKRVTKADSGNYRLILLNSDGTETSRDLQVIVEAPIGSVEVSIICSSNQTSVSCSSEGDQIIYNWTLNGIILEQGPMSSVSLAVKTLDENQNTDGQKSRRSEAASHSSAGFGLFWKLDFREMMLIFGLMLLLQTTACLDRFCRFDQSDPCYAALGHKLSLLMVQDTSEYDLQIIKRIYNTQDDPVCRVKYGRMKECDLYNNRAEVTVINGTLIINHVIRADSGNYRLRLIHSDGTETSRDLQVIVEAPIGSVEVSVSCSSNQRSVSCSSEGDQITYNWTLNGIILEQGPMARNTTIQLNETSAIGNISCSVKNNVSYGEKTISVKPCPVPTTPAVTSTVTSTVSSTTQTSHYVVVYLIAGCAVLIVILLFITACYVYKKKRLKSTPDAAGDTELTYADISEKKESLPTADGEYAAVRRQTKRKERKKEEDEVQYGEVTFISNRSKALQPQEECIYSQVVRR
ncbi:hypothetical protein ROHU_004478 [Labeo rohita]|uniref:Ig-like domain-containing protein n=1 Tax=Labeo rohita TaxID=84645 RepID=A0A498NLQ8_LABRO|nr:hypothetical protein ROHU_004478 [Labeo rohita]